MKIIGREVTVVIDRPLGSTHPKHTDISYPINYGFVPGILGGDGEEQDAYVLGVDRPLETFTGEVVAIIHRLDDVEDKWVVAPKNRRFSEVEIREATAFQEQYFQIEVIMDADAVARMPQRWRQQHSESPRRGTWE